MPTFSILSSSRWPKKGQAGSDSLKVSGTAGSPAHGLLSSLTFTVLTKSPDRQAPVSSSSSNPCQQIFGYCRNSSPDPWGSTEVGSPYSHEPLRSSSTFADALTSVIILSQSLAGTDWEGHTTAGRHEKMDKNIPHLTVHRDKAQNIKKTPKTTKYL